MDYTMVGSTVNLASRLEHEAPPGGVLISFETFAHVKDEIVCAERGHIQIKGIAQPVATYEVVGLAMDAHSSERAAPVEIPHFRLEIAPDKMSAEERRKAAAALRQALGRLDGQSGR
jgi:hypothetical protein